MKIDFITFTKRGSGIAVSMQQGLKNDGHRVRVFSFYRQSVASSIPFENLVSQTELSFTSSDAVVFISACSVAVKAIAPLIGSQKKDPAVIILDEELRFLIPLLTSNSDKDRKLINVIAENSGTEVIISGKESPQNEYFGLDNLVRQNNLHFDNKRLYNEIISDIVSGEKIGFRSYFSSSVVPEGMTDKTSYPLPETGIYITYTKAELPFKHTLFLFPKCISIGISCKSGTSKQKIENHIMQLLSDNRIPLVAVEKIASVSFKKNEQGILDFCKDYNLPFFTYEPEQLAEFICSPVTSDLSPEISEQKFSVSEKCAMICSGGRLIEKKFSANGISTAIAVRSLYIDIE